jgi:glutathione-specific gamma-glutamylcyclotransferase
MPTAPSAPTADSPGPHQVPAELHWRDPQALLDRTLAEWGGRQPLWLFAYASLLWKREFDVAEHRSARVAGWHRAFRMRSRVNRGTPDNPGLVFALMAGGSCCGGVYRLPADQAETILRQLWLREMPTGVYEPRWLTCRTPHGSVQALAFTLDRRHPAHTGRLDDERLLAVLRQARGRYGSTLDYLLRTAEQLQQLGIQDREIQRMVQLARRHGMGRADRG